jgi:hypothetical protein
VGFPQTLAITDQLNAAEMRASLAIFAMWMAVAVAAVWGPDIVSTSAGNNSTVIPSGVAVALFATIGSWAVAKHAFRQRRDFE